MSPAPMLEALRRRPGFRPGREITLCGGRAWTLAMPRPAIKAHLSPVGPSLFVGWSLGPGHRAAEADMERLWAMLIQQPEGSPIDVYAWQIGWHLARANYAITVDEWDRLLAIEPGDPDDFGPFLGRADALRRLVLDDLLPLWAEFASAAVPVITFARPALN